VGDGARRTLCGKRRALLVILAHGTVPTLLRHWYHVPSRWVSNTFRQKRPGRCVPSVQTRNHDGDTATTASPYYQRYHEPPPPSSSPTRSSVADAYAASVASRAIQPPVIDFRETNGAGAGSSTSGVIPDRSRQHAAAAALVASIERCPGRNATPWALPSSSDGVKDTSLKAKAKTKDFKIVLEDTRVRGLVLEDSNTGKNRTKCFGEAPNTLHINSVIGNGQNSKLLPLKSFVQNMQ